MLQFFRGVMSLLQHPISPEEGLIRRPFIFFKDAREDFRIFCLIKRNTKHHFRIFRTASDTDHYKNRDAIRSGIGIVPTNLIRGRPFHDGAVNFLTPIKSRTILAFDSKFLICRFIADDKVGVGVGFDVDTLALVIVVPRPVIDGEVF